MSIQQLLDLIGQYPWVLAGYFTALPLMAWLLVSVPSRERLNAADYASSVLIYLSGIPGMISGVLIGYALFLVRSNLLEVDFLVYFVPVISMSVTFLLVGKRTEFVRLPGFDRLSGLMMLIGLTFLVVLILYKLRILVGFFASIESFVVIGVILFLAFKSGAKKLLGR